MNKFAKVLMIIFFAGLIPVSLLAQTTSYDTLSIYDLQYVSDPATRDASPFWGDTVVVKGMVMNDPRALYVGARWACFIADKDSFPKPWSGFFIIQNDTLGDAVNTLFGFVEPGMECYFTGVMEEYPNAASGGLSELALLTSPVVPIEIISTDNPLPDPVPLTTLDLTNNAQGEQWESMWISVNDVKIVSNAASSNRATITDDSDGLAYIDDYFLYYRTRFNAGSFDWPPPGTLLNVSGFIRQTAIDQYGINPRDNEDVEQLSSPPLIEGVSRTPGVPNSGETVTVSGTITDNIAVVEALLHYSVNWGDFIQLPMTLAGQDSFVATIPNQSDDSLVRYFISAKDDDGDETTAPGDTANSIYFYVIRSGGLSIKDLQYTWDYPDGTSGYRNYAVNVEGIVTSASSQFFNSYYIQEAEAMWSGIWISDPFHTDFQIGDKVEVTGTVQETFGVTRIAVTDSAGGATLISSGNSMQPVTVTTGEITTGGENAEAYESVLIKIENLTVTNPFPDSPGNYGEFSVDDGTGAIRVDDNNTNSVRDAFRGNLDSTFAQGDPIDAIVAIHSYSFGNYKILPRDNNDILGHTDIEDKDLLASHFSLKQNYPNPFNPQTTIEYTINTAGDYNLSIYNVLGQKVVDLTSGMHRTGLHQVVWNGLNQNGIQIASGVYFYKLQGKNFNLTKKLVLLQ